MAESRVLAWGGRIALVVRGVVDGTGGGVCTASIR
jgi:hypothetical protein